MNILTLFEFFLLAICFYCLATFSGLERLLVPSACLFCLFWVQRLEKKQKEDAEAKKRLLHYKLEKHHEQQRKEKAARAAAASEPN
ncbi:MAG: hypothetical protein GY868_10230 [Deltaproteobacteria bacterium]|nr:hypothetical protein [Deltaproteobacteria bacterium]